MRRSCQVVWVDPMFSDRGEAAIPHMEGKGREGRDQDQSDMAEEGHSHRNPKEPCQHLAFGHRVSRTMREYMSVVSDCQVFGHCYGGHREPMEVGVLWNRDKHKWVREADGMTVLTLCPLAIIPQ